MQQSATELPQTMKPNLVAASAVAGVVLALVTALECRSGWIAGLLYGGAFWLWWSGVSYGLWRAGRRWPVLLTLTLRSGVLQTLIAVALAFAHRFALYLMVQFMMRKWPAMYPAEFRDIKFFFDPWHLGIELLLYGLVCFACAAAYSQVLARRSLELEKQLAAAQLRALQMQIEPHFLLNTLNSLTALVELDRKPEALKTLARLNSILKMTLRRSAPSKIPLTQELEIVKSYLEIEQMRFADRLHVDMRVDPNTLDALVPSFILQPIVENAIRHGIAHCEAEGKIETYVTLEGNRVQLRVLDNGNGTNHYGPGGRGSRGDGSGVSGPSGNGSGGDAGFGIGLSNTTDRLSHFYKDDYDFGIRRPETGGFEVVISIPYERKSR
jgi:anti-sigma regulatory factor (Ser/Thr protein kinase)